MLFKIKRTDAARWAEEAQLANLTYFRIRRELFTTFTQLLGDAVRAPAADTITISYDTFIVIKYYLTSRNDFLDDNKRLAFDRLLGELGAAAGPVPRGPGGVMGALGF